MNKKYSRKFNKGFLQARAEPSSFDEKRNTIDVIFATGTPVRRFDWRNEEFYNEVLDMSKSSIRLDRLNSGAPVLNTHDQFRLEDVIGVVEQASISDGKGFATLRLSENESNKDIINNIRAGILRNISVGYKIHKAEERAIDGEIRKEIRAVDWEPLEVSFVPIPADSNAQVRSDNKEEVFDCIVTKILKGDGNMDPKNIPVPKKTEGEGTRAVEPVITPAPKQVAEPQVDIKEALKTDRKRTVFILDACKKHSLSDDVRSEFLESQKTIEEIGLEVLRKLEGQQSNKTLNDKTVTIGSENRSQRMAAYERSLLHRSIPKKFELEKGDNEYNVPGLHSLMRTYLRNEHGERNVDGLNNSELVKRALHTGPDFAQIVENIANKSLMAGYMETSTTYQQFVMNRMVPDLKDISVTRISSGGVLAEVQPDGEYTYTSVTADGEKYRVKKYGEIIGFTEELLINDDLNAFTQIPMFQGQKVQRTENEFFWDLILTPQLMADNIAIFHADHNNLAAAGSALSVDSLSEGRTAFRLQEDPDGKRRLNLVPKYLVVPAALETAAQRLVTMITPRNATDVNPFSGQLEIVVESLLDSDTASTTPHYLFGNMMMGPMAEKAMMNGVGPQVTIKDSFDTDGMRTKIKHYFGMRVIDYRQFYKNPGVV